MAISDEHPEYTKRKIQWSKLRDCAEGQEAVHAKKTEYLPKLSGQSAQEYDAYLKRALFYGATSRTIDGLSGMVFRKDPQVTVPTGIEPYLDDVTLGGLSLEGFAEQIIDDDITVGRAGILVDHPFVTQGTTVAQAEALNIRPFLKHYTAEQIFNWKTESRNNSEILTQVRLWEFAEVAGEDEFETECRQQIRVLDFDEFGQYRQRMFVKVKTSKGEEWAQFGQDIIPLKNGAPLNVIPFFFVGVKNGSAQVEKPPLIDLANANLSHYLTTADLEHGAHFTGLPTAVVMGHTEDDAEKGDEWRIGAATAWIFPNPETKVQFLEFQGQGLGALENRIIKKEEYMAFLGARMLSPERKGVETAEVAQIHRQGETSVLSSLVKSAGVSIEKALEFMAWWAGFEGDVEFHFNNDFMAVSMSPQQLTALLATWQAGGMAYDDFLDNLKRGEVIREDRSAEDIRSEIETQNPFSGQDMTDNSGDMTA